MSFKIGIEINYNGLNHLDGIINLLKDIDYVKLKGLGILPSSDLDKIDDVFRKNKISWFSEASSIVEVDQFRDYYSKLPNDKLGFMIQIPANQISNIQLLDHARSCSDYLILTIGPTSQNEVDKAIGDFHPNLVIYEPADPIQIDYLKYLSHIQFEFTNPYSTGFSNISGKLSISCAAMMNEPNFILHSISDESLESLDFIQHTIALTSSLSEIRNSRGGYGFLSKNKKKKR
jgi:hypothetical protein